MNALFNNNHEHELMQLMTPFTVFVIIFTLLKSDTFSPAGRKLEYERTWSIVKSDSLNIFEEKKTLT